MLTITRKFEFDAGHRVLGHEGKCASLHGHRYVAEISFHIPKLDKLGRVIDFSQVKQIAGDWIDYNWDHAMILNPSDPLFVKNMNKTPEKFAAIFGPKDPFIMPDLHENPTAENLVVVLANYLTEEFEAIDGYEDIKITHIRLYETPNCWADYQP